MATDNFDPRFDAAYQRGYEEPAVVDARARFNPWLLVLWILGIGLTAAGIWAQSQLLTVTPASDTVTGFYVVPALLREFAPWLVSVGLAGVVAAVFLHALRWRDRDD